MNIGIVNSMDRPAFVRSFGGIFEHSPWVAEWAYGAAPFVDATALHEAMIAVVKTAARERQLALLRAHPDLAGKEAQAGVMTDASVAEQASAGLDRLSKEELTMLTSFNIAYRAKHGFPFIIAVRLYDKDAIFAEFERRIAADTEAELKAGLEQIYLITAMRLAALFGLDPHRAGTLAAVPATIAVPIPPPSARSAA